jgi:DNA mismatch repair protein MutL
VSGIPQGEVHPILEKAREFSLQEEMRSMKNTDLNQIQFYHLFYATLACHTAVRAGDTLNAELVQRLLQRSHDVDFFAHCPHGRPVIRKFDKKDVESWFLRI